VSVSVAPLNEDVMPPLSVEATLSSSWAFPPTIVTVAEDSVVEERNVTRAALASGDAFAFST
jgi:hypothetical protein